MSSTPTPPVSPSPPSQYVYRASNLGGCSKALIAARLGYEPQAPPDSFAVRFAEGDLHEGAVLDLLRGEGEVADEQLEVALTISSEVTVDGHIDAKAKLEGWRDWRVVEVKTMSKDAFASFKKHQWNDPSFLIQKYKWQISAYMVATGLEGFLLAKDRNSGEILRVGIELPFYTREQIVKRVMAVEMQAKAGLPEECDSQNYPCPFFYLHKEKDVVRVQDEVLDAYALAYTRAVLAEKEAKEITAECKRMLMQAMTDPAMETDSMKVSKYEQGNSPSLDTAAMKEDGVYEKYLLEPGKHWRVKVTKKEQKSG